MAGIILIVAAVLTLLVLGIVQAVQIIVLLFTAGARRRQRLIETAQELRRLRDSGHITPEVFRQVMEGLSAAAASKPPMAHAVEPGELAEQPEVEATPAEPLPLQNAIREEPAIVGDMPAIAEVSGPIASELAFPPLRGASGHRPPPLPSDRSPLASPAKPAMFASFLERRNIRWGELLGGLLILGCSTALVVSFWAQIADRPIFKFALFTLVTAGFFGVGLYSEHRWKLPTTSRAILLLAMLLVPINLLAIAALGGSREAGHAAMLAQLASLIIFTALAWPAARVLAPMFAAELTCGLAGTCLALVIVTLPAATASSAGTIAALPTVCFLACSLVVIARLWRFPSIALGEAIASYLLHGVVGFAAWLALGFLYFTAADGSAALTQLSGIITAMALPAMGLGLTVWRVDGSKATLPREQARRLNGDARGAVSGLAVAIFGVAILLAGLLAAWPALGKLVPIGVFDALLLLATAIVFDVPAAYIPAAVLGTLVWLVGLHTWPIGQFRGTDASPAILAALQSPNNGWLILPIAAILGAGGMLAARLHRRRHASILFALAMLSAAASVAIALLAVDEPTHSALNSACLDLLVGLAFILVWTWNGRGRWWSVVGSIIPLLLAEAMIVVWTGNPVDPLIFYLLPALPIALAVIAPTALAAVLGMRRKFGLTCGLLAAVVLLETACIALAYRWGMRWNLPHGEEGGLLILRIGHVVEAWMVFALGNWLRRRFGTEFELAAGSPVPSEQGVLQYQAQTAHRGWRLSSFAARGIVAETVRWTVLTGILAFGACLMMGTDLSSCAIGMLALAVLAGCLACWAEVSALLAAGGVLLNFAGTFALL